jgi:hypothetical protein
MILYKYVRKLNNINSFKNINFTTTTKNKKSQPTFKN